jgi:hypothetical protein
MKTLLAASLALALSTTAAYAGGSAVAVEDAHGYTINNYYVDTGADTSQIKPEDIATLKLVPTRVGTEIYADGTQRDVQYYLVPALCIFNDQNDTKNFVCAYNLTATVSAIGLLGRDFINAANATVLIKNHKMYIAQ